MVSYSFDDNAEQFDWLPWQLGIGSMACMFCAVFFGLKFKWFRAQLNLGESKRSKAAPVEGIGFKLKTNPDDFQSYKVISEFAPVPFKPAAPNSSLAANKVTRSLSHSDKHTSQNGKPSNSFAQKLDAKTSKSKSMEQLSSFATPENVKKPAPASDEPIAQVTNPMYEAQNNSWRRAADGEDDNKKKKITFAAEPTNLYEDEPTDADDAYFLNVDNSMYSSQAASIFFGSRPAVANSTRNNNLRRDSYNESIGSDTSA